jgi:formate/nitrite transporter FocA (FNT family)
MMWKKEKTKDKLEKEQQKQIDKEIEKSESPKKDTAKSHGEILREQLSDAQETYEKSPQSILLSSLTAGLEIGFSYLMICSLVYFLSGKLAEDTIFKMMAFVYPLGFILVVLGQSILFTEQTALLTLPVLNKKRDILSLLRIWGLVISGNLIGGYLIALLLLWLGPNLNLFDQEVIVKIAKHVLDFDLIVIFVSSILAGWLMGLLSWLLASARDTISRIVMIFLITGVMAFTGLHHSIIGSVEIFSGMMSSPEITFGDYLLFQSTTLLGNAFGGAIFVALLKYRAFVFNVVGKG